MAALLWFLLMSITSIVEAGSLCAGFTCDNGQCISKSFLCNGNCDCADCSDEKRCPFHDYPSEDDSHSSGLGSSAIVGIVVAAICILLLIVGILIVLLICRIRREAQKNLRRRRACLDRASAMDTGCALPVNIPIEALTRQPPPSYTPTDENVISSSDLSPNQFSISSVLPPPYYSPVGTSSSLPICSAFEAPPKYQSLNDFGFHLKPLAEAGQKKNADQRLRISVDSFVDIPSMSNILRSSTGGCNSDTDDDSARVSTSQSDSARGYSLEFESGYQKNLDALSSVRPSLRVRSQSLTHIASETVNIPECGLRKYVNGSEGGKRKRQSLHIESTTSVPANAALDDIHIEHAEAGTSESQLKSGRKQKQRKFRKKDELKTTEMNEDNSSKHFSTASNLTSDQNDENDGLGVEPLKSRRQVSLSLPQLRTTLYEETRLEEIGSCDI